LFVLSFELGFAANSEGCLLGAKEPVLRLADGGVLRHHLGVSCFAEYALVSRKSLIVIPKDVPWDVAAILGCAGLTGLGAVFNSAPPLLVGETGVVIGLGAVGLMALLGMKSTPGVRVIAVDVLPAKRALAERLGAIAVAPENVANIVGSNGASVVVEASGRASALELGIALAGRGGTVVAAGLPHPSEKITTSALQFAAGSKKLVGCYMGDSTPNRDVAKYISMWKAGLLPLESLISDTKSLNDINVALDDLADGKIVRRLFTTTNLVSKL
jgi:Zn-dependent alcohol dehydrogenase